MSPVTTAVTPAPDAGAAFTQPDPIGPPAGWLTPLADATDPKACGGKASTLARLLALGMPVPGGVVLTCRAFDAFVTGAVATAVDAHLLTLGDHADSTALQRVATAVRELVLTAALPPGVTSALREVRASALGACTLAVRSSAVGEDGASASFAGQFDSVLHVDQAGLEDAVRVCWASYWSARALFYRRFRQIPAAGIAIVIQRQVDAAAAGVLFTINPDPTAGPDEMAIEYGTGLADRLVAGDTDPDRLVVARSSCLVLQDLPASTDRGARLILTDTRVAELAGLALQLEHALGAPQDIEWTIDRHGCLAIVQSRPVTTPVAGNDSRAALWSNANVSENFPEPVTPLLYSIASAGYYHYFRNLGLAFGVSRRRLAAMDGPLRTIIGVHGARIYYNLTNIHAVLRMAPCGDRLAEAFNLFVGAERTAAPPDGAEAWRDRRSRTGQVLELARIAGAVVWQFVFLGRRLRVFERGADAFAQRTTHEALRHRSLAQLGDDLAAFIDIRCRRWKNASLCDAAAMVSYALLRRLLARSGFGDGTHTRLLRALPGVPSVQPTVALWKLSRRVAASPELGALLLDEPTAIVLARVRTEPRFAEFRADFETFLNEWGFRSSGELMLATPTLDEQPGPVIALLKQYVGAGGESPVETMVRQAGERRREARAVLGAIARRAPMRALVTWVLLRWTQGAVVCRERARLKQALLYTRCRRVALRIGEELVRGGRCSAPEDVLMLTWQEIEELCAGRAMFPTHVSDLVALRRAAHAAETQGMPPDSFRLAAGEIAPRRPAAPGPPEGGSDEGGGRDRSGLREGEPHARDGHVLHGVAACGGRTAAPAAVLAGVHEAHRLTRGDVLVTRQTDPGWAPVFCLVSGLVIERGGMLSHGAIIAREFGLPCLVGVRSASTRIPHGATLTVDADAGTCHIGAPA